MKAKESLATEANKHVDAVVAGVKFLHSNGLLPMKVAEAFSRGDGVFTPATVLRNVTAEQLVPRADRPKRGPTKRRRVRDANGNLVPSKASQAE